MGSRLQIFVTALQFQVRSESSRSVSDVALKYINFKGIGDSRTDGILAKCNESRDVPINGKLKCGLMKVG